LIAENFFAYSKNLAKFRVSGLFTTRFS
jgi:hypothetical protein